MLQPPSNRNAALAIFHELQQYALATGVTLRTPPPEPTTCCGRGCEGCVWGNYYAAVGYWQEDALLRLQP